MQDREHTGPHGSATSQRHRKQLLLGLGVVALAVSAVWLHHAHAPGDAVTPQAEPATHQLGAGPAAQAGAQGAPVRLADFEGEAPSPDARLMANWVVAT